ncbi:MAG: molybdopterin biosynthesis protein, partial [Proteobacteria bacterium]|nr:molybdopterin biosynthesis protein [Pseudomonadota bacterium]
MKRDKYLKTTALNETLEKWRELTDRFSINNISSEEIEVDNAYFRTLAREVTAKRNIPPFSTSAVDGIAVRAETTLGAREVTPKILYLGKDFEYINTGFKLPGKYNAVIMIENVERIDDSGVRIRNGIAPRENVRKDVHKGDIVFYNGEFLTPEHIAVLISAGIKRVSVKRKIRFAFIPTGNEITYDTTDLSKIIESNSYIIRGNIERWGGIIDVYKVIPDDYNLIKDTIIRAYKNHDVVVVGAGSSHGTKDYTSSVLKEIGKIIVHGTNLRPGKPVILGEVEGKPFIGLPGYSYAFKLNLDIFIGEIFRRIYGNRPSNLVKAITMKKIPSQIGLKHYYNINLVYLDNRIKAFPVKTGSSKLYGWISSTGYTVINEGIEGVEEGETIYVHTNKSDDEIKSNLLFVGSNDILIGELGNALFGKNIRLFINNAGSMGGIFAMQKRVAHFTGIHLFNEEKNMYNIPFVKKYLNGKGMLVHLAKRSQGLLFPKGNPKGIRGLRDIADKSLSFINRQIGAGTRIKFDYLLKKGGISIDKINGYDNIVNTHMDAGYIVKEGYADCTIAIEYIARMLDLGFIHLFYESYDLYFPEYFLDDKRFKMII